MVCACARAVGKLAHQGSSGCSKWRIQFVSKLWYQVHIIRLMIWTWHESWRGCNPGICFCWIFWTSRISLYHSWNWKTQHGECLCCVPKPRACPLLSQKTQMGGQVYYIMSRKIIKNRLLANCTPGNWNQRKSENLSGFGPDPTCTYISRFRGSLSLRHSFTTCQRRALANLKRNGILTSTSRTPSYG